MAYWVDSGHLVEAILVLTIVEWLGLSIVHRRTGRGPNPSQFALTLLSGACLLLALRASLIGSGWFWVAAALTAALFAHVADLVRRWDE